jgi:metal-responsive CopG/Arc/MetJ family transcriptional regulator
MYRLHLYLPEQLKYKINSTAKLQKKSKAEVVREALEEGLKVIQPKSKPNSIQGLLDLAKMAEKIPTKGKVPKDLVENLDYYTWGGEKDG